MPGNLKADINDDVVSRSSAEKNNTKALQLLSL